MNEQVAKFLKNGTGVVPTHVWYGKDPSEFDRPSYLAVKTGKVQFEGSKSQCKIFVSQVLS